MYPSSPQSRPHPTGVRRVCGRICQPVPAPCRWPFWQIGQPPSGRAPLPGLGQQLWHLGKLLLPAIKMEIRRSWFRTIQSDTQMVWLWLRNFVSQTRHAWWGQHIIQNDSFRRGDFGWSTLYHESAHKTRTVHDSEWFICIMNLHARQTRSVHDSGLFCINSDDVTLVEVLCITDSGAR